MFICKRCDKQFEKYDQLRRHTGKVHKIHSSELYVETYLNGIWPVCKCGCGEKVKWRPEMPTHFMNYVIGHNARGDTNPIHSLTPEQWEKRKAKHSATNKAQFALGHRKMWSDGRRKETDEIIRRAAQKISENKERSEKISRALSGKKHSFEHRQKVNAAIKKAWANPSLREKQRQNRLQMIRDKGWHITSKLEKKFSSILNECNIQFIEQFFVKEIGAFYDFYIESKNLIIEVHGDFWHCNPETKHKFPKYDFQLHNLKNDEKKRIWAENNKFNYMIFWESDINNNSELVKTQLMQYIS